MNDILNQIGEPAALEQLAEECTELGKAALKLARKMRGENPTPISVPACRQFLAEEVADVLVCLNVLSCTEWWDADVIQDVQDHKELRGRDRLKAGDLYGKI